MTGQNTEDTADSRGDETRQWSRREVLKTGAVAVATVTAGTAAASSDYAHLDVPEHVTVSTAESDVRPWQPRLSWDQYPEQDPLAFYGMRLSSPEYADDCVVGFHRYAEQRGVSDYDSHDGDHEPVYVFFNPDDGSVTNVVCSGYHWFASNIPSSSIRLVDTDRGQQPVLRVVDPWHHHLTMMPEEERNGRTFEIRSLHDSIGSWLTNGMASELRPDQPYLPWRMPAADDWWRSGALNEIEIAMKRAWVTLGVGDVPDRSRTGWDQ